MLTASYRRRVDKIQLHLTLPWLEPAAPCAALEIKISISHAILSASDDDYQRPAK